MRFIFAASLSFMALAAFANEALERQMLSHVESILVVDSIAVGKDDFLKAFRIQPSAGRLLSGNDVTSQLKGVKFPENFQDRPSVGFTNEFNDYLIWAQEDTTGYLRLAESVRLVDGSWSQPEFTSVVLNFGTDEDDDIPVESDAAFPFMSDDGQTLYFAADNEQSLGGYDIFVAMKDPSDGEFLIPRNLGMPFNSAYDDYMMVLDRQTGVGWWATDRNQLEDRITIYVFAITDERSNVDPQDEYLLNYASLSGWKEFQDEEQVAESERLRNEISKIKIKDSRTPDFELPMPDGKIYRYYSDFKNHQAANLMKSYLRDKIKFDNDLAELEGLRHQYYLGVRDKATSSKIRQLEKQLRTADASLKKSLNEIYKLEN